MTRQEYDKLLDRFMSFDETKRPPRHELMRIIVDLFYTKQELELKVYGLEETLDGRD